MIKLTLIAALAAVTLTSLVAAPAFAQKQRRETEKRYDTEVSCGAQLGTLRRVFPEEVAGITDEVRVWVTPICEGGDVMSSDGNAVYLIRPLPKTRRWWRRCSSRTTAPRTSSPST